MFALNDSYTNKLYFPVIYFLHFPERIFRWQKFINEILVYHKFPINSYRTKPTTVIYSTIYLLFADPLK